MQINSPKNLSALYNANQVGTNPQPEKSARRQDPASVEKTDSVSISTEALRRQAETKKNETATDKDDGRSQQQSQSITAPPASNKNLAAQRIDIMA